MAKAGVDVRLPRGALGPSKWRDTGRCVGFWLLLLVVPSGWGPIWPVALFCVACVNVKS